MFLIRQARYDDANMLLKLAKMVHFINLPADKDVVDDKIRWSEQCFKAVRQGAPEPDPAKANLTALGGAAGVSAQYMFAIEDLTTGGALGCSAAISRMGAPGHPNVYLKLRKRHFFSDDLQTGATHMTAQLQLDQSGPSEIGALILAPAFRGRPERLGKQLSFIRFHYIGLHRDRFQDNIVAEMMAPITRDGRNSFWDHFGRRFINLSYDEADRFCAKSREFMTALLPREEIYLTLLPPHARALVGRVGKDTEPARVMLERLGFAHSGHVDPFDAGPIFHANIGDIPLVRDTRWVTLAGECNDRDATTQAIISLDDAPTGGFRAAMCNVAVEDDCVLAPAAIVSMLRISEGARIGFTPISAGERRATQPQTTASGKRSD